MTMIEHIRVANYKVLGELSVELSDHTVFVGANGCGKSSVVEVLAALAQLATLQVPILGPQRLGRFATCAGASVSRSAAITTLGREDATVTVVARLAGGSETGVEVGQKSFRLWSGDVELALDEDRHSNRRTLRRTDGNPTDDPALAHLGGARYLAADPRVIAAPVPLGAVPAIGPDGAGLADALVWLAANAPDAYLRMQSFVREVLPDVDRVTVRRVATKDQGVAHQLAAVVRGAEHPAPELGTGLLCTIALATLAHCQPAPTLLLVDNIDCGLHPTAQERLVAQLRATGVQLICTTQSPYLLEGFAPANVRVMALGADGTARCRPLTDLPRFEKLSKGLSAGELWASVGEEWVTK